MVLKVLGSGSSGNTYLLENETECLVIEAGVKYSEVKKAIDFQTRKIVGVVVSHIHKDHSKYVSEYLKAGIPVFRPYDMDTEIEKMQEQFGLFKFKAFSLTDKNNKFMHNNAYGSECPCYCFYITHSDMGKLVYISDTELVKWNFAKHKINHILIEANHSASLIDRNSAKFTHQITGHMNIDTTCKFLEVNNSPMLRNVILCQSTKTQIERILSINLKKFDCPDYVAEKGLQVNMDLVPF